MNGTEMQKLTIDYEKCSNCRKCVELCPANVFEMQDRPVVVNEPGCTRCGVCADQCPKHAIVLETPNKTELGKYKLEFETKEEYRDAAKAMIDTLGLKKSPVAVKLVTNDLTIPTEVRPLEFPVRHCVAINMAAYGAVFYLPAASHACAAAKAALGMAKLPEKVKNGKVPYMHGLAASQTSAAKIMADIPKLEPGTVQGTLVAPLEKTPFDPDVVILTVNPKQAMWAANAYLFEAGGPRLNANFAGMQASCGDATVIPYMTDHVNFTVGCYGCRSAGKLADDEMYVGIPIRELPAVVRNLQGLKKAMRYLERSGEAGNYVPAAGAQM